ncbi:MAG: PAS domain-containing protein [Mediterranea massiliensis]|nr:PAS domain-containing protein [Mediterranea massiliensis]
MKLKYLFTILATLLVVVWLLLLVLTVSERGLLFYLSEGVITISLLFLFYFYRKVVAPLDNIAGGMDLLREQDFSSRLSLIGQHESDRIVTIFNKMLEQLKNERLRLREQNQFLDLLIEVSPMGVIVMDFDERIKMVNKAAQAFLHCSDKEILNGRLLTEINAPLADVLASLEKDTSRTVRMDDAMIYRCTRLSFVNYGFHQPFFLIESLTDEVHKAEKKAYEKVIRMISHEVNNSVAGITSTLDSVTGALQTMDDTEELCEVMKVCIERSYSMSRFITNFADVVRIPEPQWQTVNLNDCVNDAKIFMENICRRHDIDLRLELASKDLPVKLDTTLFEQVLINVLKNAAESIGQQGEIIIRTQSNPIQLEVIDNGSGISKETEEKLFTPFFSTKPNGQGIGLIFIREVLTKHSCDFSLRTCPDGLTRFTIRFKDTAFSD